MNTVPVSPHYNAVEQERHGGRAHEGPDEQTERGGLSGARRGAVVHGIHHGLPAQHAQQREQQDAEDDSARSVLVQHMELKEETQRPEVGVSHLEYRFT